MLEALDRGNLFLVPLDDRRQWYRYHHLFADVLRARLLDEQPDAAPDLHRRASEWYEQNGERVEAIRHALTAKDFERAADLVELAGPAMRQARQEATLRRWFEELPAELFQVRPVLAIGYVGALMATGELAGVERAPARRRAVAGHVGARGPTERRVGRHGRRGRSGIRASPGHHRHVPGGPGRTWAEMSLRRWLMRIGCSISSPDDHLGRGAAAALIGLAYWSTGDLDAAYRWYADGQTSLEKAGNLSDVVGGAITLADIRIAEGRLRDAMSLYERGLQVATAQGGPTLRGAADMHVGMSELFRERNDLERASQHCWPAASWAKRTACRRTPTGRASRRHASDRRGATGWRARAARRGCAPVRRRLLSRRPPRCGFEGTRVDRPGETAGGPGLGEGEGHQRRGRAQLRPRVRARHAGEVAPGAGHAR